MLAERLLLLIYAYGTNAGVRAVAVGGHGHSEDDLRYARRRYFTVPACRDAARAIANATFAARQVWLWGEGTTAVASDSTHVTAFDQNIFTEWHSRYRGGKRGVLIYWTVERGGAMAVHSQLLSCSASEVHAMVEGAMRHGTDMTIESSYVDSHGASFIGFGITRLLGFDLIARFKQINHMKLYLPDKGTAETYPLLEPALTRPIRWELITQQYDPMIKYATAIRLGTASTEAILRRFTRDVTHPAYAAMLELGRAQRTIFLARWLRDRDLQRETTAALNVVENYNGVNDYIRFGKSGHLSSNRREEQELSMLCLHILQSCLGFINTLMIQDILAGPQWADVLGDADRRGLTPTAKGRRVGRPSVVTESQLVHATQLRADGRTIAEITAATGLTRSTLYRHLPARGPEPVTAAAPATDEFHGRSPAAPACRLTCPSCGHQPVGQMEIRAHREEMAIMWLHLDGEAITEARHCVICQPHGHVIDAACADCGDGPLITGQPPDLGDHPAERTLNWLCQHGWQTHPDLLCPAHAH